MSETKIFDWVSHKSSKNSYSVLINPNRNQLSFAELYYGAYNSSRVEGNLTHAERFIQNVTVVPLDNDSLKIFGELKVKLRKLGQPVADFD